MKKFVIGSITSVLLFAAVGNAVAEDNGKPKLIAAANDTFSALDRNKDHRLSRSEAGFDRLLSQTFAEIDTDGDGFVSQAEFANAEKTLSTVSNLATR